MIVPTLDVERQLWNAGCRCVAGVDEVGRGAWAGPVVAAAVALPADCCLYSERGSIRLPKLLRDSKKLNAGQRQQVADELKQLPINWAIGEIGLEEINQLGIGQSAFMAMRQGLSQLATRPDFVLIDGFLHPDLNKNCQKAIVKGDALVASIAAASVLAKVYRDQLMSELDAQFPVYNLAINKGYGTKLHQSAIREHGLSPIHRRSFHLKFMESR